MALYEIPLAPVSQIFKCDLFQRTVYMRVLYCKAPEAGWILDIGELDGTMIVGGIPLVTGADLLEQYEYLGLGVRMYVTTAGDPDAVPTYENLGVTSHLYIEAA